ncbi:hypothetical protein SDC9_166374 [bioreactor metagenome]|uniref:Uncharacterized protein n=1 Tax=bioreactor metagenome TaxID=1076179 RepID=A0A645FWV3_9ZZZZ
MTGQFRNRRLFYTAFKQSREQIKKWQNNRDQVLPIKRKGIPREQINNQRYGGDCKQNQSDEAAPFQIFAHETKDARKDAKHSFYYKEYRIGCQAKC